MPKTGVHPGNQRAIGYIRNQCVRLVGEPFLVPKKEIYDYHRSANQVIIKILFENAELVNIFIRRSVWPQGRLSHDLRPPRISAYLTHGGLMHERQKTNR